MALRATYFLSVIYGDPVVGGFTVIVKLRENCLLYPAAAELRPAAASSSISLSTRDSVRWHRGSGHDWADLLKWNFAIMNISQEL